MMVNVSTRFEKDLKKAVKSDKKVKSAFQDVKSKLESGQEIDKKYKLHKLDGCFKGYHSVHLRPDMVMIFEMNTKEGVVDIFRVGTHADIIENRKWSPKLN